jgi:hypothetical protein
MPRSTGRAHVDERQDANHNGAKAEHQHHPVGAKSKQDDGAAATCRDCQLNVIRIGSSLARRMQIVAKHPFPHGDFRRKVERGLSIHELDVEARHEGVERIVDDAAVVQVDFEGRAGHMGAGRQLDFLHRLVVGDQEDQLAISPGASVCAVRQVWRQIGAQLHALVGGVDAERLEIDLRRRARV